MYIVSRMSMQIKHVLLILLLLLPLGLYAGCAAESLDLSAAERLALGEKHLLALEYEQAVAQFLVVIDLEPMNPRGYTGAAEAYVGLGQTEQAIVILRNGANHVSDDSITALLNRLLPPAPAPTPNPGMSEAEKAPLRQQLAQDWKPIVEMLSLPFTVDGITLGVSGIDAVKAAYADYPHMMSNHMVHRTAYYDPENPIYTHDSVYTCYGTNGNPIPEGYEENNFGILFLAPLDGGGITDMTINDPTPILLGGLQIGDSAEALFSFFGLPAITWPLDEIVCEAAGNRTLSVSNIAEDVSAFTLRYTENDYCAAFDVRNNAIHSLSLFLTD